ncbi:MAG: hypothetical protein ACI4YB_01805 [Oscillospiraceae bacterium]
MTKEQIIRSLECCEADFCAGCPINNDNGDCRSELYSAVIDFIEQQEIKINRLNNQLEIADEETQLAHKANITYVIECEESKKNALKQLAEDIKTEFYKEFEELIPSIMADNIDELVRKAIGGKENSDE